MSYFTRKATMTNQELIRELRKQRGILLADILGPHDFIRVGVVKVDVISALTEMNPEAAAQWELAELTPATAISGPVTLLRAL